MMKTGKHPGRIRWALSELLLTKGLIVSPYDLWTQEGGYRRHTWDLARWGSSHARWANGIDPDGNQWGMEVHLSSWSTMTQCVRNGIEISKFDSFGLWNHASVEHAGNEKRL